MSVNLVKLDNISQIFPLEQAIKALKIEKDVDNAEIREEICEMIKNAYDIAKPKAVYIESFITGTDSEHVYIDEKPFDAPLVLEKLTSQHSVFPYVATSGTEIDAYVESFHDDPLLYFYADQFNIRLISLIINELFNHIKTEYNITKIATVNPGSLEGWHISGQKQLFPLIGDVKNLIGVELTESFLMVPLKSTSGIIFTTDEDWVNCQRCPRENCINRRVERIK